MRTEIFRRITAVAVAATLATGLPKTLLAGCVNQSYPNGTQTITCCGDGMCCTTTWRGSVMIAPAACF